LVTKNIIFLWPYDLPSKKLERASLFAIIWPAISGATADKQILG
jgi:hypothetical protein